MMRWGAEVIDDLQNDLISSLQASDPLLGTLDQNCTWKTNDLSIR
jgi:hypothetical protein